MHKTVNITNDWLFSAVMIFVVRKLTTGMKSLLNSTLFPLEYRSQIDASVAQI